MLKIESTRNVWITSDTHYSHKNICRSTSKWVDKNGVVPASCTRNFQSLSHMNDTIVNNINNFVGPDDILIHLGDWSFGGFENIKNFRERLICKEIHLVLGNHDEHIEDNREDCQSLFASVQWFLQLNYRDNTYEMMHYPLSSWNKLKKGRIHLHGHMHLPNNEKITNGRRMDVGIDGHPEFRPYDLQREIINHLIKLPIGFEMGDKDHHSYEIKNSIEE